MRVLRLWILRVLLIELLVISGYVAVIVHAQDLATLERRVAEIDKGLSGRVLVLESDMAEVKWLTRGVTMAVIGQLVVAGMGLKDRKGRS